MKCETCIYWKNYYKRARPNMVLLDEKAPCNEPYFCVNTTMGEQNKKKSANDTCVRWAKERPIINPNTYDEYIKIRGVNKLTGDIVLSS